MTFSEQTSPCWDSDKALASTSFSCSNSNDNSHSPSPSPKVLQLEEEITALELQIMYLERHLLSLYRKAFQTHSVCSKMDASSPSPSPSHAWPASCCDQTSPLANLQPTRKDHKSAHRSLADHLGAFSILSGGVNADRLSEDIVRCISSIYCKMGSPIQGHGRSAAFSTSPTWSLSSSPSLFSSGNPNRDTTWSWSPRSRCNTEDAFMIHIRDIHLDDHTFNYAATMLQNFRSLVRNLEKIDPRKMKREEKLAFWINIHNALVMHAYLAYGTGNRPKTASVLKAAYNVGGHCINAYCIQSSILRIRSRNSAPWLQTLFPGRSVRHEYALDYPEPLVHFALSYGDYSDPPVRVYTAKHIFEELRVAKEEFVKRSVEVEMSKEKETKVLLPRVLDYFAKDMSLGMQELLEEIVEKRGLDMNTKMTRSRGRRRSGQNLIRWLPHSSRFGYMIHPDLAKPTTTSLNTINQPRSQPSLVHSN